MIDVVNHKNFCPLPWMHLYKDTNHSVKLCCADKGEPLGDLRYETFDEIRNNTKFREVRQAFLNDERLDRCQDCWYKESNGSHSLRQGHLDYIKKAKSTFTDIASEPITYLDYRTSNLCNLGCKICTPHFSTKLAEAFHSENLFENKDDFYISEGKNTKEYFLGFNKQRIKFNSLEPILSEDLQNIYFAGGEPILADEHWHIIAKLKKLGLYNVKFLYNTNFTLLNYKGKSLLEELKDFKEIFLNLSLDGIEKSFDYWRTGGKWETILNNLNTVKTFREQGHKNIYLGVNSAVGWLNFKEVFRLHKFLIENEYIEIDEKISSKLFMQPVFNVGVSFEDTPPIVIDEILQDIEEYEKWVKSTFTHKDYRPIDCTSIFKSMIAKKKYTSGNLRYWLEHNKKLDRYFKTKFFDVYKFRTKNFSYILEQFYRDLDNVPIELQDYPLSTKRKKRII